ncbi:MULTISPECIES: L7Ae/L30e/S12e/Gadd45 family ribosomal protein [Pelosinus]|jgi:large subunit ribosomal protein L7A|uniref:Ribosomal protein L7Ae/L30e/S12e/Gadd45 n=2 Tax=Pelosinus TaxID=365348 RepID=I8TX31_9FIRM|nr:MULTISPECIES: ribosomal L7Ae/L30e/S12e/Gadd45 family protein [Pelosinus]AJQ29226.1 ribosomal protein L7Ae/L30e/S12e/Gadd45 [Pelosinus fermentans JBW45]MCC5467122.1 ribosomal L7Ae/L30e/S12e/Gadd45 family protein [Pelosinus baikalensis]
MTGLLSKGVNSMSLEKLKIAKKIVGVKQVTKAVEKELVQVVYIAQDAEQRFVETLRTLCERKNVAVEVTLTMAELGSACGIEVGAAAVAVLK